MTLALLCQFTAQYFSDVNTSIFRSLGLLGALLCRLYCADLRCVGAMQAEPLVVQPTLGYHITNNQARCITPTHLKSAQYSLHNNAPSSRKLLKVDILTSETCWAVNLHNKASVIKLVYLYSDIKMMHGPICIKFPNSPSASNQDVSPASGFICVKGQDIKKTPFVTKKINTRILSEEMLSSARRLT